MPGKSILMTIGDPRVRSLGVPVYTEKIIKTKDGSKIRTHMEIVKYKCDKDGCVKADPDHVGALGQAGFTVVEEKATRE